MCWSSCCARAAKPEVAALSPAELRLALGDGAVLVDTRPLPLYLVAHLPGALPIEFNLADLAERAALWLPAGCRLLVHAEPARTVEASVGLLEDAGFTVLGHLSGGLQAWTAAGGAVETLPVLDPEPLALDPAAHLLLDVREPFEYRHGHIGGALPFPLDRAWEAEVPDTAGRGLAVFCSGQGRAAFVAGLLRRRGLPARLVGGGMYEWMQRGYPVVQG